MLERKIRMLVMRRTVCLRRVLNVKMSVDIFFFSRGVAIRGVFLYLNRFFNLSFWQEEYVPCLIGFASEEFCRAL